MIGKIKIYLAAAGFMVLAFLGVYGVGFTRGQKSSTAKRNEDRLDAIKAAREIEDEIQNDPYFVDRASRWLRKDD